MYWPIYVLSFVLIILKTLWIIAGIYQLCLAKSIITLLSMCYRVFIALSRDWCMTREQCVLCDHVFG